MGCSNDRVQTRPSDDSEARTPAGKGPSALAPLGYSLVASVDFVPQCCRPLKERARAAIAGTGIEMTRPYWPAAAETVAEQARKEWRSPATQARCCIMGGKLSEHSEGFQSERQ